MPALSLASWHDSLLVNRNVEAATSNVSANATSPALQVICAWPVSGQYGPGTRVLYYVLVAACIFARKMDWLRNACLAAVLLFPAVAAFHGIVLAALNLHGAVDMDVYGAFQLCSIGILTAPVAVRVSRTYFYDPGRNIIFLWTILILAGLLSLTVEFFRIQPSPCPHDGSGKPVSLNAREFPYGATCGLTCSVEEGPWSPMRGGSANNIYVIPAPDRLTFGTATLIGAACCIPAILSLISMWNKVLEINWKRRFGTETDEQVDEPIEGTNGATKKKMDGVNSLVRLFLSAVEIPVLGAAVIAILIIGEMNFFSAQVFYQTEPVASIGQWAPLVGAGLAVLGSLYLVLAAVLDAVENESKQETSSNHDNCSMHEVVTVISAASSHSATSPGEMRRSPSNTRSLNEQDGQPRQSTTGDSGNRRKVARALSKFGIYLSNAAHDRLDNSGFKSGRALDFPEIPGEFRRNRDLPHIRNQYNPYRDAAGNVTPSIRGRPSRAGSFTSSIVSGLDLDGPSSRSQSPSGPRQSMTSNDRTSFDTHPPTSPTSGAPKVTRPARRDTLEVPAQTHHSSPRNNSPMSPAHHPARSVSDSRRPPAIVVSSDQEDTSTATHRTMSHPPPSPSSPGPVSVPQETASPTSPRHGRKFTV